MRTENLVTLTSVPLKNVPSLWEQNDVLIFLIDLDDYDVVDIGCLNNIEKEDLEKFKTKYFKKRYIVSRLVLKNILCHLLNKSSVVDISIYKDERGKVNIPNYEGLHICISYSKNIISLAVSKVRLGIDIEIRRPLALKSAVKYLQTAPIHANETTGDTDLLKVWTMKEAYSKFSDKSMFFILDKEPDFNNACCSNYLLDNKYIFSVITYPGPYVINISYLEKIDCT